MKRSVSRGMIWLLTLVLLAWAMPDAVSAGVYSTGFKSSRIGITSPAANGLTADGALRVEGLSGLEAVWFCVRGPGGELYTHPAPVTGGAFSLDLQLRFGPGTYTVWAGDNSTRFDGAIRFMVTNSEDKDSRYLSPSACVDSEHPEIQRLARKLSEGKTTDLQKVRAIHDWTTSNLAYDYGAYLAGTNQLTTASETIRTKTGLCRDYAFVVAALARAVGLEARVVYGQVKSADGWPPQQHAWNEVSADGRWVSLDTTWDSGYVRDNRFVAAPSSRFFNPDPQVFALTHSVSTYATH